MKRFKVVAKGLAMDAEIDCNDYAYDAKSYYDRFVNSGQYYKAYIVDNFTGELYDTYDIELEAGGVKMTIWSSLSV